MLAEIRTKSQITIPKEIMSRVGLNEGDKVDIFEKDGVICLLPVTVYPTKYLEELRNEVSKLKEDMASGNKQAFENVEELFTMLDGLK